MSEFFIEFLTRSGCHLCDEAAPIAFKVARLMATRVVVTDIDSDPEMAVDWDLRVPAVLDVDGKVLCEGLISFRSLLGAVAMARLRRLVGGSGRG